MGPKDNHATAALQYARTLDATKLLGEYRPTVMYAGYETEYLHQKSHILDVLEDHPQKELLINSCAEFLLRPYFTRVWCQQEASLSADPVVVCGDEEIPWMQIFALAWLFQPRFTMTWPDWFLANYPWQRFAKLEPHLVFISTVQQYRLRQMMMLDKHENSYRAFSLVNAMRSASRFKCFE
jgi:hypothetical protein